MLLAPSALLSAGGSRIRFARVSGATDTPLRHLFPRTAADEPSGAVLPVGDKLAGNALFNFGAFYRTSWRANDWLWGRLDAASHLVELLTEPARLRAFAPGNSVDELVALFTDASTELAQTRRLLTARLQWEILAAEVPVVDGCARADAGTKSRSRRRRPVTHRSAGRTVTSTDGSRSRSWPRVSTGV